MIPDVTLNGKSIREMGWIRENIDFPTPQSQTNTIVVPEEILQSDIQKR